MSARELFVLGTSSHLPTRYRNHNGYFLRWDNEGILFDPGEGTQRQMTLAGLAANDITRICVTHLHGDHCLGLPGIIQRLSAERVDHPVDLYFPSSGQAYIDRLRRASIFHETAVLRLHPVYSEGEVGSGKTFRLSTRRLDHGVESIGYRVAEPDGVTMLPDKLAAAGVSGPAVRTLLSDGVIEVGGRAVRLAEVSRPRSGQRFAFLMDTRRCASAVELARGADMVVSESTFLRADQHLADSYAHMTAADAAQVALDADARLLVLTHFSQRYPDEEAFLAEARAIFPNCVAARDLMTLPFPRKRSDQHPSGTGG